MYNTISDALLPSLQKLLPHNASVNFADIMIIDTLDYNHELAFKPRKSAAMAMQTIISVLVTRSSPTIKILVFFHLMNIQITKGI